MKLKFEERWVWLEVIEFRDNVRESLIERYMLGFFGFYGYFKGILFWFKYNNIVVNNDCKVVEFV